MAEDWISKYSTPLNVSGFVKKVRSPTTVWNKNVWHRSPSPSFHLGTVGFPLCRCNATDRPASLRCNALFWGGLRPLRCCVASHQQVHFLPRLTKKTNCPFRLFGTRGVHTRASSRWFRSPPAEDSARRNLTKTTYFFVAKPIFEYTAKCDLCPIKLFPRREHQRHEQNDSRKKQNPEQKGFFELFVQTQSKPFKRCLNLIQSMSKCERNNNIAQLTLEKRGNQKKFGVNPIFYESQDIERDLVCVRFDCYGQICADLDKWKGPDKWKGMWRLLLLLLRKK